MTQKCGRKKKVAQKVAAIYFTDFLTTSWFLLWAITVQTHGNLESIFLDDKKAKCC